jgi:hypothetical protein
MSLITPTIHLNGTSKAELAEQLANAANALMDARKALQAAAPNGRDYYPQGEQAIAKATDQHRARLMKLREILAEIQSLQMAVAS